MSRGLQDLYAEVKLIAERAGYADYPRPEDRQRDDRVWLAEASFGRFDKFYMERGQVSLLARGDYDTVLYEVFKSLVQDKATHIEARNRIAGQDSRRQWFALQAEMMESLKPEWAQRIAADQATVLGLNPFQDEQ